MISLYTGISPNGLKVSICLEELELSYKAISVDMMNKSNQTAEFIRINPNGKIPAIVDHDADDFHVWE